MPTESGGQVPKKPRFWRLGLMVTGVIAVFALGAFTALIATGNRSGTIKLKLPKSSVEIDIKNNEVTLQSAINTLFKLKKTRRATLALLAEFQNVYHKDDPRIIDSYQNLSGTESKSDKLRYLLQSFKGPFKKKFHYFRDISNVETVNEIMKFPYDHDVSKKLREISQYGEGVFSVKVFDGYVSFVGKIEKESAAVCNNSRLMRQYLTIRNKNLDRATTVFAKFGVGICNNKGKISKDNWMQIGFDSALLLFGKKTLNKYEPVSIYVSPKGYKVMPFEENSPIITLPN